MLGKPSSSPLRSPAPQVQEPRDLDAVDDAETWVASLPIDLILEIFLRLEPAAVLCCAGVCKPWRRTIIGNAAILGANLDRFFGPSLLLGMFQYDRTASCLWRMPGPFQSALPSNCSGGIVTRANSLMPAAASVALSTLLWSKDGFILLKARSVNSLCMCNPVTGYWTIVPAAAAKHNQYILLTGPSSGDDDNPAVRILAVHRRREFSTIFDFEADKETLAYQLFSTSGNRAGAWGPVVQCFGDELEAGRLCVWMDRRTTAVGRDCVYWLAGPTLDVTCVFALDVRTGRTWTMELPVQCHVRITSEPPASILSMSSDGRLSLIQSLWGPIIQVWVLSSDDDTWWILQRTIPMDVHCLLSHCPPRSHCRRTGVLPREMYLNAFCPWSRCVIAKWSDQELLVDIASGSSHPHVGHISYQHGYYCWPYEIDSSSTYISKMKHF